MTRLSRRVYMWGGAVALAAGGFAFMASNTVAPSSAGQGSAVVTGYTVSNIQYSTQQGWGQPMPAYSASTVKFILTADAPSAPANLQPAGVNATLLGVSGPLTATSSCNVTSWASGSGAVVCNFASPPLVSLITGLDVEANQ